MDQTESNVFKNMWSKQTSKQEINKQKAKNKQNKQIL